jgi:uncharacterized protein
LRGNIQINSRFEINGFDNLLPIEAELLCNMQRTGASVGHSDTHPDLLAEGDAKEQAGDFDAARRLFERGGKLGQHYCWSRLAYMYDVGIGVRVDKAKAMSYYRRSWRKGEWVGATNIAILYRWFLRAAEAGDGDSFVEVAKCYRLGMGVRKNHVLARRALDGATASDRITEGGREEAEELLARF